MGGLAVAAQHEDRLVIVEFVSVEDRHAEKPGAKLTKCDEAYGH